MACERLPRGVSVEAKNTLIAGRAIRAQIWGSSSGEVSRGFRSLMVDVLIQLPDRSHFLG